MRNGIVIILLLLAGVAYGQSELKEIQSGDLAVYRCDSTAVPGLSFSIKYPKSFRQQASSKSRVVRFYRGNSPLTISVYVYDLAHMKDTSQAYYDTAVVKHYQTKYEPIPMADTMTLNGHKWNYYERTSEETMKSGTKWYYKSGQYSMLSQNWLVSVHLSITLNTDAAQTAAVFERYKATFLPEMRTLQISYTPVTKE